MVSVAIAAAPVNGPVESPTLRGLLLLGFQPGPPDHITPHTRQTDAQLCHDTHCPGCRAKGQQFLPFRSGISYRVVTLCVRCGRGEEL
jgi:hypothetical protein